MFNTTLRIIRKTEGYLLGFPEKTNLMQGTIRFIVFPIKYLKLGANELFKPVFLWWLAATALLVISWFITNAADIEEKYSISISYFCIFAPMILVIFQVPSTYCFYGVEYRHVKNIVEFIDAESLKTSDEIDLLEQNIKQIDERISSRVSFYKWLVGAIWTVYIVTFNIEVRIVLKANESGWEKALMESFTSWAVFMFITLIALALIVGYKRASEILVKSIEFACVEYKCTLSRKGLTRQ